MNKKEARTQEYLWVFPEDTSQEEVTKISAFLNERRTKGWKHMILNCEVKVFSFKENKYLEIGQQKRRRWFDIFKRKETVIIKEDK